MVVRQSVCVDVARGLLANKQGDRLSKIYLVSSWDGVWKCLIGFVVAFMGGEYRP